MNALRKTTESEEVGRRIRSTMEERGLTQKDLEAKTGIKQPVISKLVLGKVRPRLDVLTPIAAVLGVSVDFLATGHAQPVPSAGPAAPHGDRVSLARFLELHGDELTGREKRLLENWNNREPSESERPMDYGSEADWLSLVQLLREEFPTKLGSR